METEIDAADQPVPSVPSPYLSSVTRVNGYSVITIDNTECLPCSGLLNIITLLYRDHNYPILQIEKSRHREHRQLHRSVEMDFW